MNETPIERVCNSPHRWLIVTGVTFLIALLTILPQADVLLAARTERADLEEHKDNAAKTAGTLPQYESQVLEQEAKLATLTKQEVDEEHITEFRRWLVEAARQAGCQVRRVNLANPTRRRWATKDSPLAEAKKRLPAKDASPFDLETRSVSLSITGTTPEIQALLRTLDGDPRIKHTNGITLRPSGRNRKQLQLDLDLWYFALAPAQKVS